MVRWTPVTVAGLLVVALAAPAQAGAFAPNYGVLSGEAADARYQFRAMPALHRIEWTENGQTRRRFLRSFQDGPDNGSLHTRIQYHAGDGLSLTDSANWLDARTDTGPLRDRTPYAKVNNVFRTAAGSTVALDEKVLNGTFGRHETHDGGATWTSAPATVDLTGADVNPKEARAFQRVIRLPDGSLVMPLYANRVGKDGIRASHLFVSEASTSPEGSVWRHGATVFLSDKNSYTESAVVRLETGQLLMMSRYDVVQDGLGYARLAYRVTAGVVDTAADLRRATWTEWKPVVVPGTTGAVRGVAPVLTVMADGVLMLTYGRPGANVTFSHDDGRTWDAPKRLYANIPTEGCPKGDKARRIPSYPCDAFGSSGYVGVAVTGPRSAYVIGDNCQAGWGCVDHAVHEYPSTDDNRLWYRVLSFS